MPDDEISRVEAAIRRVEASEPTLESATNASIRLRTGQDRSRIVGFVFWAYVGFIAAITVDLLYHGLWRGENVFTDFSEILKIAVVPIVTLVIGYYFGAEKAEQSKSDRQSGQ